MKDLTLGQIKRWVEEWKWWILAALGIVGFLFWTVPAYIRSQARAAVLDEKFLGELAGRVRPQCVFNMKGAILTESPSFAEYVAVPIQIERTDAGLVVKVRAKKHLRFQPLVNCISYEMHTTKAVPSAGYDWEITLLPNVGWIEDEVKDFVFRLEILH